jgi:hypothetical protein
MQWLWPAMLRKFRWAGAAAVACMALGHAAGSTAVHQGQPSHVLPPTRHVSEPLHQQVVALEGAGGLQQVAGVLRNDVLPGGGGAGVADVHLDDPSGGWGWGGRG